MSDDQYSASQLRQRVGPGGSVSDDQLSASQLRARSGIQGGTGKDRGSSGGVDPMVIVGGILVIAIVIAGLMLAKSSGGSS
mmetsp:Transcript_39581/g.109058  ORF Transcript_39581/g.109058 Transcript_39581/m.109058 type:complete len:81 (+) Transcript_39581:95-337(+)